MSNIFLGYTPVTGSVVVGGTTTITGSITGSVSVLNNVNVNGLTTLSGTMATIPFMPVSSTFTIVTASAVNLNFPTANNRRTCLDMSYSGSSTCYVIKGTTVASSTNYSWYLNNGDVLKLNFADGSNLNYAVIFGGTTGSLNITEVFI